MNPSYDRILEELVFERVRASVRMCELLVFQRDLDGSIERVLSAHEVGDAREALRRHAIDAAWQRLGFSVSSSLPEPPTRATAAAVTD